VCFGFDVLSFFVSAGLVLTLTIKREGPPAPASSVLSSLVQGFRFIFSHAAISFVMIAMASGMFAFRAFGALLSIYVRDILAMQSRTFGILNSLIGFGMIAGTQLVRRFSARSTPQHGDLRTRWDRHGGTCHGPLRTAGHNRRRHAGVGIFLLVYHNSIADTAAAGDAAGDAGRVMSSLMSLLAGAQVVAMVIAGPTAEVAGIRNVLQRRDAGGHRRHRLLEIARRPIYPAQSLNSNRLR
jgi:hypothetical protein